jgi:ParB family transcriptional regulator, chromosome partitioning protein
MSATTTHTNTATNEAQFLAPETHQRANGQDQDDTATGREGLRLIPLSKLVPSPLNVRKTGGTNIDELAMLIDAHGLLQQLLVAPHLSKKKSTGKFEVVGGERRRRALRKLAELGKISKDEEIPCKLVTREQAIAMSMAENSGREAMSVADTVVAFRDMLAAGATVDEVALSFGITPLTVRRRLKLANVSPRLFELFRQEQLTLDQLMSLAVVDDHEAQERVWDSMSGYERNASNLRRQLLGREIDAARDPVAQFVGIEAYEAAGGAVTRDLFADEGEAGYISNAELLYRLAKEKLDGEAAKIVKEGWKWIETRTSFDYSERHAFAEAPMGMRDPTPKEQEKLDALAKEQADAEEALEALYEGDEADFDQKAADDLERQAEKASREADKLHAKMRRYDPDVLAIAGAVVAIDHGGRSVVYRGLVKPEDKKEAKRVKAKSSGVQREGQDSEGDDSVPTLSESLHRKLTAHRTKALQVLVADNAHVALASVVHALLLQVVIEHSYRADTALAIRANDCEGALGQFADDMKGSKADEALQAKLDNWRERIPGDADRLLPWLLGQDDPTLMELLALCAALSLNALTATAQAHPADAIATAVGLDMADWWTATAGSYFAEVPKARIADAISEAVSVEASASLAKLKKAEAVAKAEALVAGTRWLPAPLRSR